MQGASDNNLNVTSAAQAATEGSVAALSTVAETSNDPNQIGQIVQAASTGAAQAAVVSATNLQVNVNDVVTAVASSAETGADSITNDNGLAVVINEAVAAGVGQGTLTGASQSGIGSDAATELAEAATSSANEAASTDISSENTSASTDTPAPVTTETEDTTENTVSPSNEGPQ
jgi:hypothetical protein